MDVIVIFTKAFENNSNRIQSRYSRFFTISSQRRELSSTRTLKWPGHNHVQITCNTSSTYHVQVSCYMPLGTKGQLSCEVKQSWNRIYSSFILLAEPLNRWRRGGNRSTQRKPLATSFRKQCTLQIWYHTLVSVLCEWIQRSKCKYSISSVFFQY